MYSLSILNVEKCIKWKIKYLLNLFLPGPALSGTLVNSIGFEWMLFGTAMLNFLYAPLLYLLRSPPTKEEKKVKT